jgi:hypothetical protein
LTAFFFCSPVFSNFPPDDTLSVRNHRITYQKRPFMRRILLSLVLLLYTTGCAPQLFLNAPATGYPSAAITPSTAASGSEALPGLHVRTKDGGSLLFAQNGWRLTFDGIAGDALVTDADGRRFSADTTLSYWDASSAASTGRDNTMSQFMLTILGVILVLGLAAIILYAAFIATAR